MLHFSFLYVSYLFDTLEAICRLIKCFDTKTIKFWKFQISPQWYYENIYEFELRTLFMKIFEFTIPRTFFSQLFACSFQEKISLRKNRLSVKVFVLIKKNQPNSWLVGKTEVLAINVVDQIV